MKKIVPVLFLAGILVLALALNLTVIAAPAPDDPETYANLLTAVQGEIDAAAFYGAAGLKALDDGYPTIAKLFFATADAEAKHADDLWAILDATGAKEKPTAKDPTIETTQENLQKAISAENYESEVMYPAFLSKAVLDREYDAATLFAYYKEAEKTHEGNFTDVRGMLLEDKEEEINSKYAVIYRCPKC
ncbi:MAG: rubrerythrin family protein, partial [Clostridiales bacterium]|nr:rubrerythrin family protein [Clostridiales bacterium]